MAALVATSAALAKKDKSYSWHVTPTGTTAHFRGLSAVNEKVAWVSGYTATDGVVLRTTDKGKTWQMRRAAQHDRRCSSATSRRSTRSTP